MKAFHVALVTTALFAVGCQCGGPRTMVVNECLKDPESCIDASVPDAGDDAGEVDAGIDAGLPVCTNLGSVSGRVCATDRHTWLVGARVSVTTTDCNGQPLVVETMAAFN